LLAQLLFYFAEASAEDWNVQRSGLCPIQPTVVWEWEGREWKVHRHSARADHQVCSVGELLYPQQHGSLSLHPVAMSKNVCGSCGSVLYRFTTSLCATSVFYWDQNWTEANAVSSISCTLMIQEPAIACTDASVFEVLSGG